MKTIAALIEAMRPYQWVKNLLVFAALIFSVSFLDPSRVLLAVAGFFLFSFASSGVYIMNDLKDIEEDKNHPKKKLRPIPSGRLPLSIALIAATVLILSSSILAFIVDRGFGSIILIYLLLNIGYSFGLKKITILDIMIVAFGFLLRALAGALIINVVASPWLFICTLMLALVFVLGKRRHELNISHSANEIRKSLKDYSVQYLDIMMIISSASAVVTYSLYTLSEETINRFETSYLIYTTPVVIYAVFRYLYLVYMNREGGDPAKMIIKDIPLIISGLLWAVMVIAILYGARTGIL